MLFSKKPLVLSIFLGTLIPITITAKSLLDEMIDEMNEVQARFERRFNRLTEELKKGSMAYNLSTETASISISENKTTAMVDVIIAPLAITQPTFDATMDQDTNTLNVTTPAGNANIHINRHFISANFNHQIVQEQENKNGKGKHQVTMSNYSQSAKTVSSEMNLDEAHIEYDQAAQRLTISIPLRKKQTTKIPVSIKEKSDK
jgi:hypothetical protein